MAKITGKVLYIYPTQQLTSKSGNAFTKRDFVIAAQSFDRDTGEATIDDTNTPMLSLTGDRCSQLDSIKTGDIVAVDFYLRGRRFRGDDNKEKVITDINVSSVRVTTQGAQPPQPASSSATPQSANPENDLPF